MKSVAVFDLDNVIYSGHSFFGWTKYLADLNLIPQSIYDRVMKEALGYKNKQISYQEAAGNMLSIVSAALKGLRYKDVMDKTKEFVILNKGKFYSYFTSVSSKLKRSHDIFLVTANTQMMAHAVTDEFGLDGFVSTKFEVVDGIFTGKISNTLAKGKGQVRDLVSKYAGETVAVGDSENDLEMLETVKHPICINPTDSLLLVAKKRNWVVVNENTIEEEILKILA